MSNEKKAIDQEKTKTVNEQFTFLLLANQNRFYGYILSLVPNYSDADDIFQEMVIVMCRKFKDFKPNSNFVAWGLEIARNKIMNYRQKRHNSNTLFNTILVHKIEERSSKFVGEMEERANALENCIAKLSEYDRQLLKLRYEMCKKISDISKQIGRPIHGLYKAFARIHLALRLCVEKTLLRWERA